jgi:hydroxypyruvate reductase
MSQHQQSILLIAALPAFLNEALAKHFTLIDYVAAADKDALLQAQATEITAVVMGGGTITTGEFLDKLPNLRCISVFGVGYDGVPIAYCKARGLLVGHTPDVLSDEVADTAMSLMLMCARQLPAAQSFVEQGKWLQGQYPLTRSVHHSRVGIVGLGRIGKTLAKRCEGFDMVVCYHGRHKQADVDFTYYPSLVEMARAVDFLVVITPGGAGTQHLVNAEVLQALGSAGFLVNVARGSVVDEAALITAINNNTIAGAGLDVFDKEPQVPQALMGRANVVLTPHIASATQETRNAMGQRVVDNLTSYFATAKMVSLIPELS